MAKSAEQNYFDTKIHEDDTEMTPTSIRWMKFNKKATEDHNSVLQQLYDCVKSKTAVLEEEVRLLNQERQILLKRIEILEHQVANPVSTLAQKTLIINTEEENKKTTTATSLTLAKQTQKESLDESSVGDGSPDSQNKLETHLIDQTLPALKENDADLSKS